jgi:hypothetical protein
VILWRKIDDDDDERAFILSFYSNNLILAGKQAGTSLRGNVVSIQIQFPGSEEALKI